MRSVESTYVQTVIPQWSSVACTAHTFGLSLNSPTNSSSIDLIDGRSRRDEVWNGSSPGEGALRSPDAAAITTSGGHTQGVSPTVRISVFIENLLALPVDDK